MLSRVFAYLRPYRGAFALALLQVALISGLELLKPWPLKLVLDYVVPRLPAPWAPLSGLDPAALLAVSAGALVLIYTALGIIGLTSNITTISIGQRMVNDLRSDLYRHLQRLSLSFYSRSSVGDLIYRVTADSYSIQTLAMNGVFPVLSSVLLLAGMFAVMLSMSWQLTLVAVAVCPLLAATVALLNRRISAVAMRARERESAVYAHVQRGMSAIKVIQAFTTEPLEHRAFVRSSAASLEANLHLYTWQTAYTALTNLLLALGTALVLWLGARRVWGGGLSVGDLVVFVSYLSSLYAPLNTMMQTYAMVQSAGAGMRRVFEVLDRERGVPEGQRLLGPVRGAVRLEDVSFAYRPEQPTLRHVSLEAQPGQMVAIVGPTGAGKSTLMGMLPRFTDPQQGVVRIDGIDVRELQLRSLRRAISMVLQPPVVFPISVRENIAYGRPEATDEEIERVARLARAHDFIARLPQGYDTVVGEQGATLSEGERQRLTIARALLRDAPILILDEPTSSVDAETEALIFEGTRALMKGRTTFVIAHRLATIRDADEVVVLRDGEIVERGTFNELVRRGGFFTRLYERQFGEAERRAATAATAG